MPPGCGFDSLGWFNLASRLGPCCQPKGSGRGGQKGRSRSFFSAPFNLKDIFIQTSNFKTGKWLGRKLEGVR